MTDLFLKIVNMSIAASWLVPAVLILRFVFKKAPRWVSVLLWGIVALRLVMPFSIESVLSLIPSAQTVSPNVMTDAAPHINTGIPAINSAVNPVIGSAFAPSPQASANPLQILVPIFAIIWLAGTAALLLYSLLSWLRLKRRVREAVKLEGNVFCCEGIASPFILGLIRPRIYVPFAMQGAELEHVLCHEMAHLKRKDHLIKPFGFLLLAVYWFNPLMWLSYILLCRDIELACDEKVINKMGSDERADYSQTLLSLSINRRTIAACPLAFGEVGVKNRVRNVLNYKRPAFWVMILALLACAAAAVCFLTDPKTEVPPVFGAVYKPDDIIYESGSAAIEDISYIILDEGNAFSIDGVPMGSMHELELTKDNFYNYFRPNKAPKALKRGVLGSWRCITADSGDMYYLILTKDALYLAAGWFDEEGLQDPYSDDSSFHWVIKLEETEYEAAKPTIPEIFMSSMNDPSLNVTDFVLATDSAHSLQAVVQYEDGESHAWRLGFIKDGVSFPVALELKEHQIIAGSLTYLGGGTVSVMIKDTENNARYEYTMSFSSDDDGINFVSGVNEIVPPQSDVLTDIAEPSLNLATLKDLVSRRGIYLTWEDFAPYYGEDVGSGLYIMRYVLAEDDYTLWIGGSPSFEPFYMHLALTKSGREYFMDVRLGDIDAFLQGEIVYNWDTLFELYYGEDGVPVPVKNLLAMNRDAALRYCFERFDEGVLEGLTLEGKSIYNAMYDFFCSSKAIGDCLENAVETHQQDWLDWSGHVKNLYERNGLSDVVFNEDSYCSRIYAEMLDEKSQKDN